MCTLRGLYSVYNTRYISLFCKYLINIFGGSLNNVIQWVWCVPVLKTGEYAFCVVRLQSVQLTSIYFEEGNPIYYFTNISFSDHLTDYSTRAWSLMTDLTAWSAESWLLAKVKLQRYLVLSHLKHHYCKLKCSRKPEGVYFSMLWLAF